jgi:hypothetical protein
LEQENFPAGFRSVWMTRPRKIVERWFAGEIFDFDVLEAVIGEARVPHFTTIAGEGVAIFLELLVGAEFFHVLLEVVVVERAVGAEAFAAAHRDGHASGPWTTICGDAGEILREIDDEEAGFGLGDLRGLERVDDADRGELLRNKFSLRRLGDDNRGPLAVVVVDRVPAGLVEARVKILAAVDAVEGDAPVERLHDSSVTMVWLVPSA